MTGSQREDDKKSLIPDLVRDTVFWTGIIGLISLATYVITNQSFFFLSSDEELTDGELRRHIVQLINALITAMLLVPLVGLLVFVLLNWLHLKAFASYKVVCEDLQTTFKQTNREIEEAGKSTINNLKDAVAEVISPLENLTSQQEEKLRKTESLLADYSSRFDELYQQMRAKLSPYLQSWNESWHYEKNAKTVFCLTQDFSFAIRFLDEIVTKLKADPQAKHYYIYWESSIDVEQRIKRIQNKATEARVDSRIDIKLLEPAEKPPFDRSPLLPLPGHLDVVIYLNTRARGSRRQVERVGVMNTYPLKDPDDYDKIEMISRFDVLFNEEEAGVVETWFRDYLGLS